MKELGGPQFKYIIDSGLFEDTRALIDKFSRSGMYDHFGLHGKQICEANLQDILEV
jgi:hypothetical protein